MKIMITGGAGFIGSNFARYMSKKYPQYDFLIYDKLTYAGNMDNLSDVIKLKNVRFVKGDVGDLNFMIYLMKDVDVVFHLAAESHVDNSLGNSLEFTKSNTYGTHVMLEAAKINDIKKFVHVSTDEVYGDIEEGSFVETDKLCPNNPYSASKAAAEMIVRAYQKTYNMPIIMTRGNNTYGPYQYPEKIISRFTCNLILGKKVPLHGKGGNIRTYIYVEDVCRALDTIFNKGEIGEIYNIGTDYEITNLELTRRLLKKFGKDDSMIEFVTDRPFNDLRYSIDISKLEKLGWKPKVSFDEGIDLTVEWYKQNRKWWQSVLDRSI